MSVAATFYFDLQSPEAYFAAERALVVLPSPCEWQPIHAASLPAAESFEAYRCEHELEAMRESFELRAAALELQPLRWPEPFPYDSRFAFRQSFAGGHALSERYNGLIAAAACEIHPTAILRAAGTRGIAAELDRASAEAFELGVSDVPAVRVGERVLIGERTLEEAGALLAQARR